MSDEIQGATPGVATTPHVSIPVTSLADLAGADTEARERAARTISHGFRQFGVVYVRDHGVAWERVEDLYRELAAFCGGPAEEREALERPESWWQRGWVPAGAAGDGSKVKESFLAGLEPPDRDSQLQHPELHAENVWPEGRDAFREAFTEVGRELHRVSLTLLRGCALALGVNEDKLVDRVTGGPHLSRALRYLPLNLDQAKARVRWGEEQTDFGLLTVLPCSQYTDPAGRPGPAPDPVCGLFVKTRTTEVRPAGMVVPASAPPGCLVARVGQQLEILSGGTFLATPHHVRAPKVPAFGRSCAVHTLHVHARRRLLPMDPFRTDEAVAAYAPPVLAGTFLTKTMVDRGLAPPSAADRLGYRHYDRI